MAMNKIQAPPALMLWQTISSPPDSILLLCLEEVRAAATIVSELRRVGPVASLAANLNTKHLRNIIDLIIGPFQRVFFQIPRVLELRVFATERPWKKKDFFYLILCHISSLICLQRLVICVGTNQGEKCEGGKENNHTDENLLRKRI